jgi:hypothetical protein
MKQANVNIKRIEQGYRTRLYFKLMLNKINVTKVLCLFIPLLKLGSKKLVGRFSMCPSTKGSYLKGFLIRNEL